MDGGFEWFVAWRHLRDPDRGRQWTLKIGIVALLLGAIGYGLALWLGKGHSFYSSGGSTPFSAFPGLGRARWLGYLRMASVGIEILGLLILGLGLLFRWFTVFTSLSIFGVFIGTAAPILALSVMSGFEADLKGKIRGAKADIVISLDGDVPFTDWPRVRSEIDRVPGVVGSAPYIETEVMMMSGRTPAGVYLRGIEPESATRVLDLGSRMKEGRVPDLAAEGPVPGIILGEELYAHILRVFTGDTVDVTCPLCGVGPTGPIPKLRSFKITGHFYSGMYEFDSKIAYAGLADVQKFLSMPGEVTGIEVRTADPENVRLIAGQIIARIGKQYSVQTWEDLNRALFLALKIEKIAMFVVLTFILLVASFSIVSNLFMLVTKKSREVAILKSMGASSRSILRVFLTEGLYIGGLGMVWGLIVGVGGCVLMDRFGPPLPADIYYIEKLPVVLRATEVAGIAGVALVLSCLAALYPALLASRLRPVEGLRYE